MRRPRRKPTRPGKGGGDDGALRWVERHDVFDRLDRGVSEIVDDRSDLDRVLRKALYERNTVQLNMRIPPAMKAALAKLARERTTDVTTLARIWLAERLGHEIRSSG